MIKQKKFYKNFKKGKYGWIDRERFVSMEFNLSKIQDKSLYNELIQKTEHLLKKVNPGQANSSKQRSEDEIRKNIFGGLLAEEIVKEYLIELCGVENVHQEDNDSSKNQIDIHIFNDIKVEVRSSFVKGFPDKVFFGKKENSKEQIYNIPCLYSNTYKRKDCIKDIFILISFPFAKDDIFKLDELKGYISGVATKEMLEDEEYSCIVSMKNGNTDISKQTSYTIVPIGKSMDVNEFEKYIKDKIKTP